MRERIQDALNVAMGDGNTRRVSTLRLILAAIKDRDRAAHAEDRCEGACEEEITDILRTMVRQREASARAYEESGRLDLAEQERVEIEIITSFLPPQLSDDEIHRACHTVMEEIGATALRDMGRCMGALKARFAGQMDFTKASGVVKDRLLVASPSPRS
ncbi:MAG: GatB/YqeY domain-containing protein [Alphaproteobacteria bacterium]